MAEDAWRCAEQAGVAGPRLAFEFHGGSLTADVLSARALLEAVGHPAVVGNWQPRQGSDRAGGLADLAALGPFLGDLHVFHCEGMGRDRVHLPLAAGADDWRAYLAAAAADGRDRWASLEFVVGDEPEAFRRDAATLRACVAAATGP